MKIFNQKRIAKLMVFSALVTFSGCSSDQSSNEGLMETAVDSSAVKHQKISDQAIGEIIKSIPSPLEISMMIKDSGTDYDNKILNSDDNSSKYNSNFKRALNLGIYGTDLGYINIYDKGTDALSYLSS